MRLAHRIAACLVAATVFAGCSGAAAPTPDADDGEPAGEPAVGLLVVDGTRREGGNAIEEPALDPAAAVETTPSNAVLEALAEAIPADDPWPAPPLLDDGTIDDGEDPFLEEIVPIQPTPIEDDPATTRDLDVFNAMIRTIDKDEWDAWMAAKVVTPFHQNELDPILPGLVRISVERCGGAHTVATGAVVAPETVVTTVHAIESTARRVRVSPALLDGQRIPAMVRYLDIDDDIAVLKVPGLSSTPLEFYAGAGTTPQRGYAYGISRGSESGAVRRAPAIVATEEESIDVEQPDGFARQITDRTVFPIIAGIDSGFSGGIVTTTSDPRAISGFAMHGLIRARVSARSDTAGIVVPARLVREAVSESQGLPTWFEHKPGGCPQWMR